MERINGSITAAIKSRGKPDENIRTILDIDVQSSLLPYCIPGMQSVASKKAFADRDGRLLIHKIFRHYVKYGMDAAEEDSGDDFDDTSDAMQEPESLNNSNRHLFRQHDPSKLHPDVIESFLTSDDPDFALDKEEIEREFGVVLTDEDIRRAICRIGDFAFVGKVRNGKREKDGSVILNEGAYQGLCDYIKEYLGGRDLGSVFDFLFEWKSDEETDTVGGPGNPEETGGHGKVRLSSTRNSPDKQPLVHGQHHPCIQFTKWKNVRFENATKIADYNIDVHALCIAGKQYDKVRKRSASFFEFSTDTSIKSGAHTAGNPTERPSTSRSDHPREFGEAQFFLSIEFDWEGVLEENNAGLLDSVVRTHLQGLIGTLPRFMYLCYCQPLSIRTVDSLTVLNRVPLKDRVPSSGTRNRKYQRYRWLDVDDMVDIIGLIYCMTEEYVCWRDACWDPRLRMKTNPLDWRFQDFLERKTLRNTGISASFGIEESESEEGDAGAEAEVEDMQGWTASEEEDIMENWTPESMAPPDDSQRQKAMKRRRNSESSYAPVASSSTTPSGTTPFQRLGGIKPNEKRVRTIQQQQQQQTKGHLATTSPVTSQVIPTLQGQTDSNRSSLENWTALPPRPDPLQPDEDLFN